MKHLKQTAAAVILSAAIAMPAVSGTAAAAEAAVTAAAASEATVAGHVPIREIAEKAGAVVTWENSTRTVTVKRGGMTLILQIGSAQAELNGKTIELGEPIELVDEKTVVPMELLRQLRLDQEVSGETPALTGTAAVAAAFLEQLNDGDFAAAHKALSPNLQAALPLQGLQQIWQMAGQQAGALGKLLSANAVSNGVHDNVTFIFEGTSVPVDVTIRLDKDGLVDDFGLAPAQPPAAYIKPSYNDDSKYTEQEVVIGEGTFALPGTLTMPVGEGPFPVLVLVHGSGPHDRDSTIGGVKPFRDLAVGLAAQNIAVLRYEKVTKEHNLKFALDPKQTLQRETVDDALEAVELLKGMEGIDPARIFVAGHSQGGMAVPKMIGLDQAGDIAGAVILSAPSLGLADTLIEQQQEVVERVKSLGLPAEVTAAYEQSAAAWIEIGKMVADPQNTVDHIPANFPLPQPYWWFEQKNYVPAETAKKQNLPLLIMQGENDWQVSMEQFDGWKQALQERKDVQFKSYPGVNHVLTAYEGVSIGAEYGQPANVAPAIIDDIAKWVNGGSLE